MSKRIDCRIEEQGNGFPGIGDHVTDGDTLYRVVDTLGTVLTQTNGRGNYINATIVPVSWTDVESNDDIFTARVVIA